MQTAKLVRGTIVLTVLRSRRSTVRLALYRRDSLARSKWNRCHTSFSPEGIIKRSRISDRITAERSDRQTGKQANERKNERTNERTSEQTSGRSRRVCTKGGGSIYPGFLPRPGNDLPPLPTAFMLGTTRYCVLTLKPSEIGHRRTPNHRRRHRGQEP